MPQVLNADNNIANANSDTGLKTGSEAGSGACLEADFNLDNIDKADLVSGVLAIEADKSQIGKKKENKSNKSNIVK